MNPRTIAVAIWPDPKNPSVVTRDAIALRCLLPWSLCSSFCSGGFCVMNKTARRAISINVNICTCALHALPRSRDPKLPTRLTFDRTRIRGNDRGGESLAGNEASMCWRYGMCRMNSESRSVPESPIDLKIKVLT